MKTVYSDRHRLHHGTSELIDGRFVPCFENPERAELVVARILDQGVGPVIGPRQFGLDPVARVHTRPFIDFLSTAWDEWVAAHGEYDALPLVWPVRTLRNDRVPEAIDGRLSYYSLDAGTPIMAGTWDAITASADVALTGADLILRGERAAFSLCRPPGHHAAADLVGGYCYLNNAAIAAQALRDGGASRVAVLDVDYHHGNGTQAIFYERSDVVFASIHADPVHEYPYFLGHADETGVGDGEGANANYPLPLGSAWDTYSSALDDAAAFIWRHRVDALVVSLGVDTFKHDPISQFVLDHDDYARLGARIARLALPTLVVFEGGYAVAEIGVNTVNVLAALT